MLIEASEQSTKQNDIKNKIEEAIHIYQTTNTKISNLDYFFNTFFNEEHIFDEPRKQFNEFKGNLNKKTLLEYSSLENWAQYVEVSSKVKIIKDSSLFETFLENTNTDIPLTSSKIFIEKIELALKSLQETLLKASTINEEINLMTELLTLFYKKPFNILKESKIMGRLFDEIKIKPIIEKALKYWEIKENWKVFCESVLIVIESFNLSDVELKNICSEFLKFLSNSENYKIIDFVNKFEKIESEESFGMTEDSKNTIIELSNAKELLKFLLGFSSQNKITEDTFNTLKEGVDEILSKSRKLLPDVEEILNKYLK